MKLIDTLVGVVPALVTPIKNDHFDPEGMIKLLHYHLEYHPAALFILGSIGESQCIDFNSRDKILELVQCEINRKIPFIVGVGRNSTCEVMQLVNQAEYYGASGVVVHPPLWKKNWINEDSLLKHYNYIIENSNIPVMLYNLPNEAVKINPSLVKKLNSCKLIGIKDSGGDIIKFKEFVEITNSYQGDDNLILYSLMQGAKGVVSGMANIVPDKINNLFNEFKQLNYLKAEIIQREIYSLTNDILNLSYPLSAEKYILYKKGICNKDVISPYSQLSGLDEQKVEEIIIRYGL